MTQYFNKHQQVLSDYITSLRSLSKSKHLIIVFCVKLKPTPEDLYRCMIEKLKQEDNFVKQEITKYNANKPKDCNL